MRNIRKTASRWTSRIAKTLVASALFFISLHFYYSLTPPDLSDEVKALQQKAQQLPRDTENGLRLLGLLAPPEVDPVVYGRCLLDANRAYWTALNPDAVAFSEMAGSDEIQAFSNQLEKTQKQQEVECAQDDAPIDALDSQGWPRIGPKTSAEEWAQLARISPSPVLLGRYETVLHGPARYLGQNTQDNFTGNYGTLSSLHRLQQAQAVHQWAAGNAKQALNQWDRSMQAWANLAEESLVSSMLSVTAMSQTLVSIQFAVNSNQYVASPVDLEQAIALTEWVEKLPTAFDKSGTTEWAFTVAAMQPVFDNLATASLWDRRYHVLFDQNGLLNGLAKQANQRARRLPLVTSGLIPPPEPFEPCLGIMDIGDKLCLLFGRNPAGQVLLTVGNPNYDSYGTRIADLRNLAAATRLTIEARRQRLEGEALVRFVAEAPDNMRDIFTHQPFSFDPAQRRLSITLQERSTVLGDGGYSLAF